MGRRSTNFAVYEMVLTTTNPAGMSTKTRIAEPKLTNAGAAVVDQMTVSTWAAVLTMADRSQLCTVPKFDRVSIPSTVSTYGANEHMNTGNSSGALTLAKGLLLPI